MGVAIKERRRRGEENEEEADERRQKAWETILSMRKSVPNDFDYKKELLEALDEKYNSTH